MNREKNWENPAVGYLYASGRIHDSSLVCSGIPCGRKNQSAVVSLDYLGCIMRKHHPDGIQNILNLLSDSGTGYVVVSSANYLKKLSTSARLLSQCHGYFVLTKLEYPVLRRARMYNIYILKKRWGVII